MATRIYERHDSRGGTLTLVDPSWELHYGVAGTEDEEEVLALVQFTAPPFFHFLKLNTITIKPAGGGVWDATVKYAKVPSDVVFTLDTGGGTAKITQSRETMRSYSIEDPDLDHPDFKGAIGVTENGVEGCDITIPVCNFKLTMIKARAEVTRDYLIDVARLTGTVNDENFQGFDSGEVLLMGVSASERNQDDWEFTFSFAVALPAPDDDPILIDGVEIVKNGWEYLWVLYKDVKDTTAHTIVKRPLAAYVEQVYRSADFAKLQIPEE